METIFGVVYKTEYRPTTKYVVVQTSMDPKEVVGLPLLWCHTRYLKTEGGRSWTRNGWKTVYVSSSFSVLHRGTEDDRKLSGVDPDV